jgi:peptide/nickel transport system substrate-binding protein
MGDRLPYLDSIFIKKIVDPAVRWTALRANDLDLILIPPLNAAIDAKKKPVPGIIVVYPVASGNQWLFFNVTKPPFDNKKVRQAIAYAIDKNELIQAAQWGLGEPIDQAFLKGSRFHVPVKDRGVDLAKAKELLAEAGYPNGVRTEFLETATYPYDVAACEYVIGKIKKIGVEAEMKVLDRAAWVKSLMNGEYAISIYGVGEKFEPDESYYMFLHSSEIGKNNYSRYRNKELDALLEKGRAAVKWEERAPFYRRVIEIVNEDLPILYLAKTNIPIAFRDYVKGFDGGAGTLFAFYDGGLKKTWLDK